MGCEKGGTLPDDLTQTEIILTKVLHGEMDQEYAILLVSAIENMDMITVFYKMKEIFK